MLNPAQSTKKASGIFPEAFYIELNKAELISFPFYLF